MEIKKGEMKKSDRFPNWNGYHMQVSMQKISVE